MWHDELLTEAAGEMPICFPKDFNLRDRIGRIVDRLQDLDLQPGGLELAGITAQQQLPELERQLDEAVFDLYELKTAERDLVHELCTVGLDLFYRPQEGVALREVVHPTQNVGILADVMDTNDGIVG
jgi:hypothetical protein